MGSQFSAFAGGGLRFTSKPPAAESIYGSLREGWGSLFTDDEEAAINVETFAQAKTLGLAAETLQRAGNEANPIYCTELLPKLEIDWRTNPAPNATMHERRGLLAAAMAVKGGDSIESITAGLQGIIGSGLLTIIQQPVSGTWGGGGVYPAPVDLQDVDGGPGLFAPLGSRYKTVRLLGHVAKVGFQSVDYEYVDGDTEPLVPGERLLLNPGEFGRMEAITVISGSSAPGYPELAQPLWANFALPHGPDDLATTMARPVWTSYRRFLHIVVSDEVLTNRPLCQRCNEFIGKTVGHGVQWALVAASGNGTTGPFTVGMSNVGEAPIEQLTWTPETPVVFPSFYAGVGSAGATSLSGINEFTGRSTLGFTTTISPSNQKAYFAYPGYLGDCQVSVEGFDQTAAFTFSFVMSGYIQYRLYESTDSLSYAGISLRIDQK
jgi:hypothetical protein